MRVGTGEAAARRKQLQDQDARIAELTAERDRYKDDADTYREALNDIAGWGQTSFGVGPLVEQMRNRARSAISVARNALKEGL